MIFNYGSDHLRHSTTYKFHSPYLQLVIHSVGFFRMSTVYSRQLVKPHFLYPIDLLPHFQIVRSFRRKIPTNITDYTHISSHAFVSISFNPSSVHSPVSKFFLSRRPHAATTQVATLY